MYLCRSSLTISFAVLVSTSNRSHGFQQVLPTTGLRAQHTFGSSNHDDATRSLSSFKALRKGGIGGTDSLDTKSIGTINSNPLLATIANWATMIFACLAIVSATMAGLPFSASALEGTTVMTSEESAILQSATPLQNVENSVVNEVWGLINKYYIDRGFNGQNWDEVRNKYTNLEKPGDNDKTMQLVTEMVKSLGDKYTRVLSVDQYAAIQKFDLIGVGVTLMPNAQKEIIVGAPPIADSPSAKAGLKSGDFVEAVNGVGTKGRTAFDIIDQISEAPNAKTVTFSMRRQGENDLPGEGAKFVVTMERQNAQVKDPVQFKLSEERKDGTKVGYIRVSEFNSQVNSKLQNALDELKKRGANAFVLDLRSNTGGAFQSAVEVSGYFFENRVATYVVDSNGTELPFKTPKGKLAVDPAAPLVVWIDGLSASASEVLAGSLHDNCRAVTMGDKSFGKGLIQAVYGLKNGAGLVLTVAKYVTPSGTEIQGIGITPDISGNMPAPVLVPVLSSDTSKVDFKQISNRLDSSMCKVPEEHGKATVQVPVEAIN